MTRRGDARMSGDGATGMNRCGGARVTPLHRTIRFRRNPLRSGIGVSALAVSMLVLAATGCRRDSDKTAALDVAASSGFAQEAQAGTLTQTRQLPDQSCKVSKIADGDSFECATGLRVRMIGIDAPELSQRPYGSESRRALVSIMPIGSTIRLEYDRDPTDRYGRALAYVWVGDTLVNMEVVKRGFALAQSFPPNTTRQSQLDSAMKKAADSETGLWKSGGFNCRPQDRRRQKC